SARGEGDGRLRAGLFGQGHEPAEVGASRFGVDLGLAPRVGDRERARLVEEGAEIVVAEADAVGRVRAGRHRLVEEAAQARKVADGDGQMIADAVAGNRWRSL